MSDREHPGGAQTLRLKDLRPPITRNIAPKLPALLALNHRVRAGE